MHDSNRVRCREPRQDKIDLRRNLSQLARSRSRDEIGHRPAFRELHRVPGDVATTVPIEDRNDGRMRELGGEPCLAPEPSDRSFITRYMRVQELERNFPTERQIADAPDRTERPGAEGCQHFVLVTEDPAQACFDGFPRVVRTRVLAA